MVTKNNTVQRTKIQMLKSNLQVDSESQGYYLAILDTGYHVGMNAW